MTKKSHKRHVRYEQSSCMWGFISILDFRQASRSNRKLLPDQTPRSRPSVDESGSTIELPINADEIPEGLFTSSKAVYDGSKTSVKALIEEEMVNEVDKSGQANNYRKISRMYSQESFDLNINEDLDAAQSLNSDCPDHKEGQDTENHIIMEEFRNRIYESNDANETSKTIVVLKPINNNLNSLSESSEAQTDQAEKASSSFFLAKIKRRWKNVMSMGKECEKLENLGDKSPNPSKYRFFIEKIARPIIKLDDSDAIDSPNSSKRWVPNIYIEARKHLSERLSNEDPESSGRRSPETLARILSLSDFNSLVPSPRRDSSFVTAKLRFSGHEEENELLSSKKVEQNSSSSSFDAKNSEDDLRTIVIIEDGFVTTEEKKHHQDDSAPTPLESPPSSPIIKKTEDLDRVANEGSRPSPVSVLESLCMEDGDISPARSSESVEVHIQPLQIKFEELSKSCVDEETLEFYIKAVIQASGMNYDKLYMKSQTSNQLLDPSLFDEVTFGCNHHTEDIHLLLFDCINEVLFEVFGGFLGSKKSIRHVQDMGIAVSEVVKGVKHWYLTDEHLSCTTGQTLDQIIENDMSKRGSWMDLQLHVEEIGVDLADEILDDIIEDMVATSMEEIENDWSIDS